MLRFLTAGESHGPMLVGILEGLPAGLQIVGPWQSDAEVLSIGAALEALLPRLVPPI